MSKHIASYTILIVSALVLAYGFFSTEAEAQRAAANITACEAKLPEQLGWTTFTDETD